MLNLKRNKVIENASWIIGIKVVQALLSFVIGMITARYLGPSNYGLVNYAASVVAFVAPIMKLGMPDIIVNELVGKKNPEGEILGTAASLSLVSSVFCIIVVYSFAFVANRNDSEAVLICVLYSLLLVFQAGEIITYWFQAHLKAKYSALASFCVYVCSAAYKIFLLISGKSVRWFALSGTIEYFLLLCFLFAAYKKLGGPSFSFSFKIAKSMFAKSKYYIVSSMMVTVFAYTDKIMLKHMMGDTEVGFYSAAIVCSDILSFVFAAIIDSFRPVILGVKEQSEEQFKINIMRLYCIITYLSLAQSIGMTIFAGFIVRIIYGTSYIPAVSALRITVWYSTFSYYGSVRNIWILAEKKQKYLWIINLSGAVLNVVLNALLIPVWGINGAAVASLFTQFFANVVIGFIIKPIRGNNSLMLQAISPVFALEQMKKI